MNLPQRFILPFVKKEQVAKDTYTFYFDRTKVNYSFIAGQYNTILLPHENPDGRGIRRFFSVSSSPNNKEFLTITTRILESTFKKALLNLAPGTEVSFEGPRGHFVLKETDAEAEYVFLVGGIGITPEMSILHFVDEERLPTKITLLVSFSTVEEMIHYKELKEIESRNPNIKIIYTITQEEGLENWDGETGRISQELVRKYVQDLAKPYFYVVGPPAMVEAMMGIVQNIGVLSEKTVKENFTGY